jgi:hypothetical protein
MSSDQGRPSPYAEDHRVGSTWRYYCTSLLSTAAPSRLQVPPRTATDLLGI